MQNILLKTFVRAEYAAPALRNAKQLGAVQYVDFNTKLAPFRLADAEGMRHSKIFLSVDNRISQLEIHRFAKDEVCFCNMLGISYHMPLLQLQGMLSALARIFKAGSVVVFDRPDDTSPEKMERILRRSGFTLCEYIKADEISARFLEHYNTSDVRFELISNISFFMAMKEDNNADG